jgi:plastocyanin
MLNRIKREVLLLGTIGLLSLSLVGCSQSNGAESGGARANSGSEPSTQSAPGPKSDRSKMEMPRKPAAVASKEMAPKANANQIVIENFTFQPATLTVKAGTKVTWVNRDDVPHTATDIDKRFNSSVLDTDDQFSYTFSQAGTYNYYCALHPKMTGQIVVK